MNPAIILAILFMAAICRAQAPVTQASGPVVYREIVRENPPLHLHLVTVDLTDPSVHIKVSAGENDPKIVAPWETALMPVSKMAARDHLAVAVNANYFIPKDAVNVLGKKVPYFPGNWARACGWAMADGKLYSENPADPHYPCFIVSADGSVGIEKIVKPPESARQIVAGLGQIVAGGKNNVKTNPADAREEPAPRTSIGFDRDHKKLIFLVVDGRKLEYSAGLTRRQLADEMIAQNCWAAIDLDGGGSSTLVMRNETGDIKVINKPSDGWNLPVPMSLERSVAVGIGIELKTKPTTRPNATAPSSPG